MTSSRKIFGVGLNDAIYPMMGKCDLTTNRIVSQPHRLVIIID